MKIPMDVGRMGTSAVLWRSPIRSSIPARVVSRDLERVPHRTMLTDSGLPAVDVPAAHIIEKRQCIIHRRARSQAAPPPTRQERTSHGREMNGLSLM